jgi:uncharacterized SAM-binding protein YcdF (DUF218 family)
MGFLLKHLVGAFASPLMITLLLLAVALILRWRGRQRASLITAASGVVFLYLCSLSPVSDALLMPLESKYHALDDAHLPQGIAGIAVLGAGYVELEDAPITAKIPEDGLARVAEGVRLAKHYDNVRLVLSGGVPSGYRFAPSAHGYAIFAREMGISPASIVMKDQPIDTADEARTIAPLFGNAPFLLVTSAYHMRRAMLLFERAGAHPIPAPTGQRIGIAPALSPWLPSGRSLESTHAALHEYLGLLALGAGLG